MDYSEVRATFFHSRLGAEQALGWASPARRLRDAVEPLATVSFWAEPAYDRYAELGLEAMTGWVWSRSSVLGDVEPKVVAAAFGVFEPGALKALLTAARRIASLDQIRQAREQGVIAALREVIGAADGLDVIVPALQEAAGCVDLAGRPLYAGALALPVPEDPHAALWRAATVARECRGDSHLVACVAAGLSGLEATLLTERWIGLEPLTYTATRAWSAEAMATAESGLRTRGLLDGDALSAAGRDLRRQIEAATDAAMEPVIRSLGDRLDDVIARCSEWSSALVERGWFPRDTYKRAAG